MPIFELLACLLLALVCGLAIRRLRRWAPVAVDEHYLLYGALRVREGEMPLRDFRSYEPGRYWWVAAFMRVFGSDVEGLRWAALSFYVCALAAALAGLRLAGLDWLAVMLTGMLLGAWAYPVYKLFEPGLLLIGFFCAVLLLRDPGDGSALLAGTSVGLAAVFGLNYGLYLASGMSLIAGALMIKAPALDPAAFLIWGCAGAALGAAPLWILMLASPAFRSTLFERRLLAPLRRGTTNLPLPIPWPWRPAPWAWRKHKHLARWVGGALFVAMPALGFISVAAMIVMPWPEMRTGAAWLAAGVLLSVAQHHAFSRADLVHLCQVMPLVTISTIALAGSERAGTLLAAAVLALAAAVLVLNVKRLWRRPAAVSRPQPIHALAEVVRHLRAHHLHADDTVLALPQLVGLYPLLGLRSPVYDTYCVYPAPQADQARMLAEIERSGVRLAVIQDHALDGREDLRFRATHPVVWAFLEQTFARLPSIDTLPEMHFFLRPASIGADAAPAEGATSAEPKRA